MICLTFDTDHMTEDGLEQFLEAFPLPGRVTFFFHHPFKLAARLMEQGQHEVGPHPTFNNLDEWRLPLRAITDQLPSQPLGLRPHSCAFSHMVGIGMHDLGYQYVSQSHNLYQPGLRPVRHPWGIWELPIYYMDNMDFWMPKNWPALHHTPFNDQVITTAINSPDLYVFDFHPLHIALNTPDYQTYADLRDSIVQLGASPFSLKADGRGTAVFFNELISAMAHVGERSFTCQEALHHFTAQSNQPSDARLSPPPHVRS